jgi:hypothetical protein
LRRRAICVSASVGGEGWSVLEDLSHSCRGAVFELGAEQGHLLATVLPGLDFARYCGREEAFLVLTAAGSEALEEQHAPQRTAAARRLRRHRFGKVSYTVTFYRKYSRALTFATFLPVACAAAPAP